METRDLSLAAALIATGQSLETVVSQGTFALFKFEPTEELQPTVDRFYARRLQIDAATYGEALRSAKAAAMAARRQPVGAAP